VPGLAAPEAALEVEPAAQATRKRARKYLRGYLAVGSWERVPRRLSGLGTKAPGGGVRSVAMRVSRRMRAQAHGKRTARKARALHLQEAR
jgi:hypothetical protein